MYCGNRHLGKIRLHFPAHKVPTSATGVRDASAGVEEWSAGHVGRRGGIWWHSSWDHVTTQAPPLRQSRGTFWGPTAYCRRFILPNTCLVLRLPFSYWEIFNFNFFFIFEIAGEGWDQTTNLVCSKLALCYRSYSEQYTKSRGCRRQVVSSLNYDPPHFCTFVALKTKVIHISLEDIQQSLKH
jgi:hypothetical protein